MSTLDKDNQVANVKRDFIIGVFFACFILIGYVFVFFVRMQIKPVELTAPKLAEASSPTPVPERTIQTLEILNGSGRKGLAASVAQTFSSLGYTVTKTGNAPNTATTTLQSASPSAKLITDLNNLGLTSLTTKLLTDSTASARIIIGKDWPRLSATP
jgi:hypothetical protein